MPHITTTPVSVTDIIALHQSVIQQYKKALHEKEPDLDIRSIFERIVELSNTLCSELAGLKSSSKDDLKHAKAKQVIDPPGAASGDRKEVLAVCLRNELSILNLYTTVISFTREEPLKTLLQSQQEEARKLHAHIKKYHDAT